MKTREKYPSKIIFTYSSVTKERISNVNISQNITYFYIFETTLIQAMTLHSPVFSILSKPFFFCFMIYVLIDNTRYININFLVHQFKHIFELFSRYLSLVFSPEEWLSGLNSDIMVTFYLFFWNFFFTCLHYKTNSISGWFTCRNSTYGTFN